MIQKQFIDRLKTLPLKPQDMVVIGSGILDVLGHRTARDVDLVVEKQTFELLRSQPGWWVETIHKEEVVKCEGVEAWLSWGTKGVPNFKALYDQSVVINGYHFAHPSFIIEQKRRSNRAKDIADIAYLKAYVATDETY